MILFFQPKPEKRMLSDSGQNERNKRKRRTRGQIFGIMIMLVIACD